MAPSTKLDLAIGATLRRKRHAAGLSQAQVAQALGVSPQMVHRQERGAPIQVGRLLDYAAVLGVPVAELIEVDGQPEPVAGRANVKLLHAIATLPESVRRTLAAHVHAVSELLGH